MKRERMIQAEQLPRRRGKVGRTTQSIYVPWTTQNSLTPLEARLRTQPSGANTSVLLLQTATIMRTSSPATSRALLALALVASSAATSAAAQGTSRTTATAATATAAATSTPRGTTPTPAAATAATTVTSTPRPGSLAPLVEASRGAGFHHKKKKRKGGAGHHSGGHYSGGHDDDPRGDTCEPYVLAARRAGWLIATVNTQTSKFTQGPTRQGINPPNDPSADPDVNPGNGGNIGAVAIAVDTCGGAGQVAFSLPIDSLRNRLVSQSLEPMK
jgi:hypothetical protein